MQPVRAAFPDLAGRVVAVTGASLGIGRAVVEALLEQGAAVFGLDVGPAPAEHASYHHVAADLRDDAAIAAAVSAIERQRGLLDGLVNCAGIDPFYPVERAGAREWSNVLDLDLRAYYLMVHHALPLLRAGVGKSVVNVSSINHRLGLPGRSLYTTAKSAIIGLSRGLARELGREGIRVNTVSPGWVFTERQRALYFDGPDAERHLATLRDKQAIDLRIEPHDVATHILFYLSGASRASTGHNCVVDAGWLLE